jgi:cysteine desulfuration protein SufE
MTLDAIRSDFALLDDWEDRYRYVIELGRALPPLPEELRSETNKVRGCASQVWLASEVRAPRPGAAPVLHSRATATPTSCAAHRHPVRDVQDKTAEIVSRDARVLFAERGKSI